MIHLITGIPGSGKSLLAVELILNNRNSTKIRPCYSNIDGLDNESLRCFPLDDVEGWFNLPDGALIVIDECQRWFRPRPNGSNVPEFISRFETHRHHGHDIILISQHPHLIDRNIRKLVELHQHQYRPFGLERRTVFEWNTCNENPEPSQTESSANKVKKPFNKELFQFYQSATVHTHKKRIPYKKIAWVIVPFLVFLYCVYAVVWPMLQKSDFVEPEPVQASDDMITPIDTQVITNSAVYLHYKGHIKMAHQLTVFLEDPMTGQHFNYQDFTGYRKVGSEVVFFVSNELGHTEYRVAHSKLSSVLP